MPGATKSFLQTRGPLGRAVAGVVPGETLGVPLRPASEHRSRPSIPAGAVPNEPMENRCSHFYDEPEMSEMPKDD